MKHRFLKQSSCALLFCAASFSTFASLQDEIQVYTDEINEPGEYGVELHMNTTPKGVTSPSYSGEVVNHHATRLTAELSRGLTKTTDIGLYVPTVLNSNGQYDLAGLKMRFKWLPIQPEDADGFFAGMNFEWGQVQQRYSESPRSGEIRNIFGWRTTNWLFVVNPIFGFDASPGFSHVPSLEIATKINRKVSESLSIGWERYNDRGPYNKMLPLANQGLVNYVVLDYEGSDFDVNFGVGRGSTDVSDKWTVKAIVGYSFGK
jgi:hypothetical protein